MAKIADRYYKVDPWKVVEEGFDPSHSRVSESIFSLGNEYMGVRGYFEEGYSGESLLGSYQNGVYERRTVADGGYKGVVRDMEFMVNSVDDLYLRIWLDGKPVDLAEGSFSDFNRVLDLRSGELRRSFVWENHKGKVKCIFSRCLSMEMNELGVQHLEIQSLDYEGPLRVTAGLDFGTHHGAGDKHWNVGKIQTVESKHRVSATAQTKVTRITVSAIAQLRGSVINQAISCGSGEETDKATMIYDLQLKKGEHLVLEKTFINLSPLARESTRNNTDALLNKTYEEIYRSNKNWWDLVWKKSDIEIMGDPENQQGIRFCIFQMYQTYHGGIRGTNIGAKGLTGEAYNGNAFWDTETYCLPFFLFHDLEAARNLLYFRYATLEEARKRARELDCQGAFYPIATISGRECCNLWQHASLQLQASTAVAYGIWIYERVTGDESFTKEYGFEMLAEISRMLATRGDYDADHKHYGFYGVMGPDEFQMMVNHNAYTNVMGKFTLEYACRVYDRLEKEEPETFAVLCDRIGLKEEERQNWQQLAEDMLIPYDRERQIFEQHEGFFRLPHVDIDRIPVEEFPLYEHWTYDRIYRNDMIKQPDVLMFLLLFNSSYDTDMIRRNYDFYEPRCIHESSLSPSVHSILAQQLGREQEAYDFFGFATRMDLDNYNRNTAEGLHTTSIAAAWMNILFGFGGLRCDGEILSINPGLPEKWKGYRFHLAYKEDVIEVLVKESGATIRTVNGSRVTVLLRGQERVIGGETISF